MSKEVDDAVGQVTVVMDAVLETLTLSDAVEAAEELATYVRAVLAGLRDDLERETGEPADDEYEDFPDEPDRAPLGDLPF